MAFGDDDFEKAQKVNSNSQLYKEAGNSICVNVLEAIFGQLFEGKEEYYRRWDTVNLPNINRVTSADGEQSAK